MTGKIKLTYFQFKARAEATRLAFQIGFVDFDDIRIPMADWPTLKSTLRFQALPIIEVDGQVVSQSHAILRYAGRVAGLYPSDALEAMQVDEIIGVTEDLTQVLSPSMRLKDKSQVPEARAKVLEQWAPMFKGLNDLLVERKGTFFVGNKLSIADLSMYVALKWFTGGVLDHIPTSVIDAYPKLKELVAAIDANPAVAEWNKAHA